MSSISPLSLLDPFPSAHYFDQPRFPTNPTPKRVTLLGGGGESFFFRPQLMVAELLHSFRIFVSFFWEGKWSNEQGVIFLSFSFHRRIGGGDGGAQIDGPITSEKKEGRRAFTGNWHRRERKSEAPPP